MWCCKERTRRRCARVACVILTHVNLSLMLFSGAALATVARLKWDPSAYIPIREALPFEYRLACALLLLFALALMALAHLALAAGAARASAARRPALFTYAALMTSLVLVEVAAAGWVASRVAAFLHSPAAERMLEMVEVREHLCAALTILARWYPLPEKINSLIDEAMVDAPRNGYAAGGAALVLLVLQPAAVLLALVAAAPRAPGRAPAGSSSTLASTASASTRAEQQRQRLRYHSESDNAVVETAPLRKPFTNARLVML